MKIPLIYPKIPDTTNCQLKACIAFEKYDGTNIHATYSNLDKKWVSFGTRRDSFNISSNGINDFSIAHPELIKFIDLFENFIKPLQSSKLFSQYNKVNDITVISEYFGPNSFAGSHDPNSTKTIKIIDILLDNDLIDPYKFVSNFDILQPQNIPKIIYKGKYSGQLIEDIRNGKYPVDEGAIIKGLANKSVYMAKIKTNAYMEKLKLQFKNKWKDYWE